MKWLFLLLVLVNLGFAGYMQLIQGEPSKDAQLLQQQIHADKVKLVDPETFALQTAVEDKPEIATCLEWGSFSGDDLKRAETALAELQLGDKLKRRELTEASEFWVYVPPALSRADVEAKVAQLDKLGVTERFIIQENAEWRNAISLGVFKSEEAAKNYLATLQAKGVRSAQVSAYKGQVKHVVFSIREPNEASVRKLTEIKQGFPNSTMSAAHCELSTS